MKDSPNHGPAIEFHHVYFGRNRSGDLLQDITFTVQPGETLVLLGRSGSGKTTTLKLINRLLDPTGGELLVDNRSVRDWDIIRLRRSIGYAIQEGALFPHFTVAQNVGLVPDIEKWAPDRIHKRVQELLQLVGLDPKIAARYPRELSGGQRQRVGVARALAADPHILLMDEPFGALDAITRAELQHEFQALQQRLHKTVVFVTHDLREALILASRIALIEDGRLHSIQTPEQFMRSTDPRITTYLNAFRLENPNGNHQGSR